MKARDIQAIARAIYTATQDMSRVMDESGTIEEVPLSAVSFAVAQRIADYCATDSPRFDRARFIEACETGKVKP